MSNFVFKVENTSTEVYTLVVAAESQEAALAKLQERYPAAPYIGYICEAQIFE
jgi:hypothetical protein